MHRDVKMLLTLSKTGKLEIWLYSSLPPVPLTHPPRATPYTPPPLTQVHFCLNALPYISQLHGFSPVCRTRCCPSPRHTPCPARPHLAPLHPPPPAHPGALLPECSVTDFTVPWFLPRVSQTMLSQSLHLHKHLTTNLR